ncbi:MAG: hypothetical protein Q7T32_13795 [Moraxellaceae bacterium]|nr:hypothetical protein [Moraxellaceae bacterium]
MATCTKGSDMPEIWAVIVTVILLMVIYAFVASKLKDRKIRMARKKSLPFVDDNVAPGIKYNIALSDGRKFHNAELVGSSTAEDGQFSFAGWEGMLVIRQETGKRVFLRQSSVRYIEEV